MGGCRCMFRDCTVCSSHHPRMHFFHIPVNDKERALKWMEMMGHKEEILKLTLAQQKNRVVCARHFHDDQFVNYLKIRLGRKAVPTLTRLGPTLALNYENIETDGLPRLMKLEPPTMEHLIPPPDFVCPLDLEYKMNEKKYAQQLIHDGKALPIVQEQEGNQSLVSCQRSQAKKRTAEEASVVATPATKRAIHFVKQNADAASTSKVTVPPTSAVKKIKRIKITDDMTIATVSDVDVALPTELTESDKTLASDNQLEEMEIVMDDNHVQVFQIDDIENLDTESLDGFTLTAVDNRRASSSHTAATDDNTKIHLQLSDDELLPQQYDDKRCEELQSELNDVQNQLQVATVANAALTQSESQLKQKHLKLMHQYRQLQNTFKELQAQHLKMQQQMNAQSKCTQEDTISTSKECNCSSTEANAQVAQPTLSKAQLFNGIKRYLSASMVPLVRMEMFGSAERQWKPDERRVSVDLLRHGEELYNYLSDEWRLRLPALRHTREWLANESNSALIDDEEDL